MAGPPEVRSIGMSEIKSKLLRPALTSHFICEFKPPDSPAFQSFIKDRKILAGFIGADYADRENQEIIRLSCSSASLPGSSLATHEINNDFTGVTERHVYRRQYDDRAEFTFYVDRDYRVIDFFENWMSYIVGENQIASQQEREFSYRVNFPSEYKTDNLYITKFEKDIDVPISYDGTIEQGRSLTYQFINAYPLSVNSMPVSYEASELLRCTVSFTYSRYVIVKQNTGATKVLLQRPNGESPIPAYIQDGIPTQAQIARQLEEQGGRGIGPNILGGQQTR